jgi:hypothetical protein
MKSRMIFRKVPPLPVEVIQEILECNRPSLSHMNEHGWSKYAPLLVCKLWNRVALSTPAIWTEITMNSDQLYDPVTAKMLWLWFYRSRSLPLHIVVNPPPRHSWVEDEEARPEADRAMLKANLDVLASTARRWASVSYFSFTRRYIGTIFRAIQEAPNLRTLDITSRFAAQPGDSENYISEMVVPGTFPKITTLILNGHCSDYRRAYFPIFGGQSVTVLSLGYFKMSAEEFLSFCTDMPNLVKLTLSGEDSWSGYKSPAKAHSSWNEAARLVNAKAYLPTLKHFVIESTATQIPFAVLNCAPSLENLDIAWDWGVMNDRTIVIDVLMDCPATVRQVTLVYYRNAKFHKESVPMLRDALQRLKLDKLIICPYMWQGRRTKSELDTSLVAAAALAAYGDNLTHFQLVIDG